MFKAIKKVLSKIKDIAIKSLNVFYDFVEEVEHDMVAVEEVRLEEKKLYADMAKFVMDWLSSGARYVLESAANCAKTLLKSVSNGTKTVLKSVSNGTKTVLKSVSNGTKTVLKDDQNTMTVGVISMGVAVTMFSLVALRRLIKT